MTRDELLQKCDLKLCRGNAPVTFDDPNLCYWVCRGEVEVFLLDGSGERWPWLRLGQDAWLLGQPGEHRLAAYATSAEGCQVACLPVELVESGSEIFLPALAGLLADYGRLFGTLPPHDTRTLKGGETETLIFEKDRCNADQGVLWVRARESGLRLLSEAGVALELAWFPIARSVWVYASSRLQLQIQTNQAMQGQSGWLAGLRLLQESAYQAAAHECELRHQALAEAVGHRQRANEIALAGGLASLARILPGAQVEEPESSDAGHNLASLCRNLEEVFGCPFPTQLDPELPLPQGLARAARCRWRRVVLRDGWWKGDGGPMMVFRDDQPGVVLRTLRGYCYQPSKAGPLQPISSELARQLAPLAYVFYQPFPREHLSLLKLGWMCLNWGRYEIAVLLMLSLLSALLALLVPVATGLLIGTILPSGLESELRQLILALLVASLAGNLFGVVKALTTLRLEGFLDARLQAALFDRLLELPVPFYRNYTLGDLSNRAMGFNSIRQALSGAVLSSFLGVLFSAFSLLMLFYYSWHLAIVACVLAFLQCALLLGGSLLQLRFQRAQLDLAGKLAGRVAQFLSGIAKLRVAGAEVRAFYQWSEFFARYRQSVYQLRMTNLYLGSLQSFLSLLGQAVILGFTAHFGYTKALSAASLMSFFSAFGQFTSGLSSLTGSLTSLLSVGPTLQRARPILETVPEVEADMPVCAPLRGLVEVKGAWFRFNEEGNWVFEDVTIEARPGEFIAVVGPSGAGKSTLLRLLLGFEEAQRGSVVYDGQNIMQIDRVSLRRQLGVVMQDARLMPGDLFTNIVGSATLAEEDAWEALRLAGMEEEVRQMPMQLHTVVIDGGGGMSGGQRQRLMIARAVVCKPRVLIFDEATSALDAKTQEDVSNSLANLQATRIVVAHRLSTIRKADRIYVLNNHRVVQVGSYDELANQPGFFADFARRQLA